MKNSWIIRVIKENRESIESTRMSVVETIDNELRVRWPRIARIDINTFFISSQIEEALWRPTGYFLFLRKYCDGRQSICCDRMEYSNGRQSSRCFGMEYAHGRQNTRCYRMEYYNRRQSTCYNGGNTLTADSVFPIFAQASWRPTKYPMLRDGILYRPTEYPILQDGILYRPSEYSPQ